MDTNSPPDNPTGGAGGGPELTRDVAHETDNSAEKNNPTSLITHWSMFRVLSTINTW